MAEVITEADIKDGFKTSLPTSQLDLLIAAVAQADACLDAKEVAPEVQRALKTYAVRHMATLMANNGQGVVREAEGPNQIRRVFAQLQGNATPYSDMVKSLDRWGCVSGVIGMKAPTNRVVRY